MFDGDASLLAPVFLKPAAVVGSEEGREVDPLTLRACSFLCWGEEVEDGKVSLPSRLPPMSLGEGVRRSTLALLLLSLSPRESYREREWRVGVHIRRVLMVSTLFIAGLKNEHS